MNRPLFICEITQKDNFTFSIEWSNGKVQNFRLADLQRCCPCANCTNGANGQQITDPSIVSNDVRAIAIHSVGRYGLRIQFTSGCSSGIYSFEQLFEMKEGKELL